jgi:putative NADH-flavin reductase
MNVLLFGASGNIGQAIASELVRRGHHVTGANRSGTAVAGLDVPVVAADATDPASVAARAAGHDAVISAIGPRHGSDNDAEILVGSAHGLIAGLRSAGVDRLLVVGGAGSLNVAPGLRLVDTEEFPKAWKPAALAAADALEVYRKVDDLAWTYLSPAALIEAGDALGRYRIGGDDLLTDDAGNSRISYPDYALALVDELEQGNALRRRITVAY